MSLSRMRTLDGRPDAPSSYHIHPDEYDNRKIRGAANRRDGYYYIVAPGDFYGFFLLSYLFRYSYRHL